MIIVYILVVFTTNGYLVPTTEFKKLNECQAFKQALEKEQNRDFNGPKCFAVYKS